MAVVRASKCSWCRSWFSAPKKKSAAPRAAELTVGSGHAGRARGAGRGGAQPECEPLVETREKAVQKAAE